MNLETLKNLLIAVFETLFDRIASSNIYNSLLEYYQSLNMSYQRWIRNGFILLCFLFIFSFPFSLFIQSTRSLEEVKTKKDLIYSLLKKDSNLSFQTLSERELLAQVDNILTLSGSPDQIQILPLPDSIDLPSDLRKLKFTGQQIEITNLNIKQAIEIGAQLDQISPFSKVIHFKVSESLENKNYFTATYSLVHFQEPIQIQPLQQRAREKEETS